MKCDNKINGDEEILESRIQALEAAKRRALRVQYTVFVILIVVIVIGSLKISYYHELSPFFLWFIYCVIPLSVLPYIRGILRTTEKELQKNQFEKDLKQFRITSREARAEKVFRINIYHLQSYYDLSLKQNYTIFGLGVFCIVIGMALIAITLYLVLDEGSEVQTKIIIGIVGSLGSLLNGFIAAIYLKMHSSASENLNVFHSRLVETQQLLFGNFLASKIEDDYIRWRTLSDISLKVQKGMQ